MLFNRMSYFDCDSQEFYIVIIFVELGIDFLHIRAKTMAVMNPMKKPDSLLLADTDLGGPMLYCLLLGASLLLVRNTPLNTPYSH